MNAEQILEKMEKYAVEQTGSSVSFGIGYLLPVNEGTEIHEKAFLLGSSSSGRPFAWIEADSASGIITDFAYCADRDFIDEYPLDASIDREPSVPMDISTYLEENKKLRIMYEKARIGEETDSFAKLFNRLVSPDLKKFYQALAPEYYNKYLNI